MRRIFLVAQREFMDNARTKSFWIGILVFPVLLGAMIIVPTLLERTKSARRYAVIDQSGWLMDAIDREVARSDLGIALQTAADRHREANEDTVKTPAVLRPLVPVLTALDAQQIRAAAGMILREADEPVGEGDALPRAAAERITAQAPAIRTWWHRLADEDLKDVAPGASREQYARTALSGGAALSQDSLGKLVAAEELFAYFVIGRDPVTGSEGSRYVSNNLTDTDLREWFGRLASDRVRARRLAQERIDPQTAQWIQTPVRFEPRKLSGEGVEEAVEVRDTLRQWAPVGFVYLLWISIFTITQMLLTNTIEEKSNRIIEVLLSSVSPVELMAGKIGGIAVTGLTIVGSWIVFLFLGTKYLPGLLNAPAPFDLSALATDPVYIVSFILYFLLGYLFYSAVMVGIGSVCTTLKEAQNLMGPITLLLIVPLMAMIPVGRDPNGTLAQVMSYIPPFTPFVMMNRAAGPPSPMEYGLTALLLVVSIGLALWAAAKVFRIGILLTGKPPKLKEILRWIRAPVGVVPQRK